MGKKALEDKIIEESQHLIRNFESHSCVGLKKKSSFYEKEVNKRYTFNYLF